MSQFSNISTVQRSAIVTLREQGFGIKHIVEELNLSKPTVRLWVRRYESEGHVNTAPYPARPRLIEGERLERLIETFQEEPFTPTRRFAAEYDCSMGTVRSALHSAGIHHRTPAKKIALTEAQKAARVRFARDYRDFDFSCAIFSDEKTFKSVQHGRQNLWRVNNARYEPKPVVSNTESGRVSVNMWAWMSAAGPGELIYIPERANGVSYLQVLQETMLPTVRLVIEYI